MMNKTKDFTEEFQQIAKACKMSGMYESQIPYALIAFAFIRRIDCLIHGKKQECEAFYEANRKRLSDERLDQGLRDIVGGLPFYNVSGYSLYSIYRNQKPIQVTFDSYLQGFSSNVKNILSGMDFEKLLAHLNRSSRNLVDIVSILSTMEMADFDGFDQKDFEYLIEELKKPWIRSREMGGMITPEPLSELMASCLCQEDMSKHGRVSILDPFCGTGGSLLAAQKQAMFYPGVNHVSLMGQDINPAMVAVTNAMLLLCGSEESRAANGNTLLEDCFRSQHFDYVTGSFPYGLSWKNIDNQVQREEGFGRYTFGLPSRMDAQFLFIQHMISKMNPDGARMVMLTTEKTLWGTDGNNIRRRIFDKDLVETIIALPQGVHQPWTSIPVYLWVMTNRKSAERRGKVQLIDARSFSNGSKQECTLDTAGIRQIMAEYKNYKEGKHSHIASNESYYFFKLKLVHHRPHRIEEVQIPATSSIEKYLQEEVFPYTKGEVDINYNSVEKGCTIPFASFFDSNVNTLPLNESSDKLLDIAQEVMALNAEIESIKGRGGYDNYQKTDSFYSSAPSHWQRIPLNVVAAIQRGQAKPEKAEDENGLPFIVHGTLKGTEEKPQKFMPVGNSKCLSKNDVFIVAVGAGVGEVYSGRVGILSSRIVVLQPGSEVNARFFCYLMKGHERLIMNMKKGAFLPQLDMDALRQTKVYLPPLDEQKRIADSLDVIVGRIDRITSLLGNDKNAFTQFRQALIENLVFGAIKV